MPVRAVLALLAASGCSLVDAAREGGADGGASGGSDGAAAGCALTDDFEDGVAGEAWQPFEQAGASAEERDGALRVSFSSPSPAWAGYTTREPVDLTEGEVRLDVASVGGEFTALEVELDGMLLVLYVRAGTYLTAEVAGTTASDFGIATSYNAVADRIWRIRTEGGFVHWESSRDGEGWASIHSQEAPFALDAVLITLDAGGLDGYPPAAFESIAIRPTGCAQ